MKVYVTNDLVVKYHPNWPEEPKEKAETDGTFSTDITCASYNSAVRKKYEQALKQAIEDAVPFEDQLRICKHIFNQKHQDINEGFYEIIGINAEIKKVPSGMDCECGITGPCGNCLAYKKVAVITPLSSDDKWYEKESMKDAVDREHGRVTAMLSSGEKEEQKRTISSVCRAWTKRDIVQLTIKDMENFEATKPFSGDTNIEEKKECLSAFEQIMLHAKSDYERLRDGWKPGTPQYESYDLVVRECVKIMTIYSATTPRPVQEKPDLTEDQRKELIEAFKPWQDESDKDKELETWKAAYEGLVKINDNYEKKQLLEEIERLKEIKGIAMQLVNDLDGTKMAVLAKMTHRQLQSALQSYHITSGKTT